MSSLSPSSLPSVAGQITNTLLPAVTKIETHEDPNPIAVVIAVSIVFVLAPVIISSNTLILAAFYRYKRLRTASNCLLASLAVSDFGVGVFMPFGVHLELSGIPKTGVSGLCIAPYCIIIALCSVSVLVTVAIAVDRLTSLAQPLRYKNIITHSSVEKYIAVFWIYAIAVGLSPLLYARIMGYATQSHSNGCRFGAAVQPPVRVFLVAAVWAPSALVLLGCYIYVYLVARAHARAIYTVELSFRHQTQTLALPRYGQTLAVTVGAFLVLWLPFQTCMLLDIFCGTEILTEWSVFWLGLPVLVHSGLNPWIYAFHHGEMRIAAGKIAEDLVTVFGIHPSRYGCSPMSHGSNLELAEINKSTDDPRPPVEDCFAAKHLNNFHPSLKKLSGNDTDISPEENDSKHFSNCTDVAAIVEEDVYDLAKMLGPEYISDRNSTIDLNHNVDKIGNLKYLLDPTFSKIRHLRHLNTKSSLCCQGSKHRHANESRFISYQNLKSEVNSRKDFKLNAMSDPMLTVETPPYGGNSEDLSDVLNREILRLQQRRDSGLASLSDSNIKAIHFDQSTSHQHCNCHGHSIQNLDHSKCPTRKYQTIKTRREITANKWKRASRQLTITANKLSNLFNSDNHYRFTRKNFSSLRHSESTVSFERSCNSSGFLQPERQVNSLTVPMIHSEPPSPINPLPLDSLREEESSPEESIIFSSHSRRESSRVPVKYCDPVRHVLLNIEDFDNPTNKNYSIDPIELSSALLKTAEKTTENRKLSGNLFGEQESTRSSSRRPSDLRWSESSRSQEVLSNLNEHKKSPSSYSVNNFEMCTSESDLNDVTCLDSFMCPDALSSSLRESFFEVPSIPDSDIFNSLEEINVREASSHSKMLPITVHSSIPSMNIGNQVEKSQMINQSKSTESVMSRCRNAISRIQSSEKRLCMKARRNYVLKDSKQNPTLAPLAIPTPNDIVTPTFDSASEIKGTTNFSVCV